MGGQCLAAPIHWEGELIFTIWSSCQVWFRVLKLLWVPWNCNSAPQQPNNELQSISFGERFPLAVYITLCTVSCFTKVLLPRLRCIDFCSCNAKPCSWKNKKNLFSFFVEPELKSILHSHSIYYFIIYFIYLPLGYFVFYSRIKFKWTNAF